MEMYGFLMSLAPHTRQVAIPKSWKLSAEEIAFCAPNTTTVSRTEKDSVSELCDLYVQEIARKHGCNLPDGVDDYIHFRH